MNENFPAFPKREEKAIRAVRKNDPPVPGVRSNELSFSMEKPGPLPEILCKSLPAFDRTDLESVRRVFQSATPCVFRQGWLQQNEIGFAPAEARVGWREGSLLIFAQMADVDIFNGATEHNQRVWELGDAFEIFLGSAESESYVEFQIAPNNQRLQLRYGDARAVAQTRQTGQLDECLLWEEAYDCRTWVEIPLRSWSVLAEIPMLVVGGAGEPIEARRWRFSFCRYDYTRGIEQPVISSTSPHAEPDFHRRHEWGWMTFTQSM